MTAFQKTIVTAALAVTVGAGVYEANQAASARARARTLEQQQAPLADQIQQLQHERDEATNQVAELNDKIRNSKNNDTELLRLRDEVGTLRKQTNEFVRLQAENRQLRSDPATGKAQRQPNFAAGDSVPVEALTFAGYTTPEATFQSTLSAAAKGDEKTFLEGFTTELRQQKENEDIAERAARFATSKVRLLDSRQVSEDEAKIIVFLTTNDKSVTLTMKRIAGEWKISAEKD